jgi:hypothetical protein
VRRKAEVSAATRRPIQRAAEAGWIRSGGSDLLIGHPGAGWVTRGPGGHQKGGQGQCEEPPPPLPSALAVASGGSGAGLGSRALALLGTGNRNRGVGSGSVGSGKDKRWEVGSGEVGVGGPLSDSDTDEGLIAGGPVVITPNDSGDA